jgi:hypothetical protein
MSDRIVAIGVGITFGVLGGLNWYASKREDQYYEDKVAEAVAFQQSFSHQNPANGVWEDAYNAADGVIHDCGIRGGGCKLSYTEFRNALQKV